MFPTKAELSELFMRSFYTFLKTFIGGLTLAGTGLLDVNAIQVSAISAAGAVLSVVQIYVSQKLDSSTASRIVRGAQENP